jgi:DNA-binding response OmpR family regulator
MKRALIVAHHRSTRDALFSALEQAGYEVDCVTTKTEARVLLDISDHDVLIANDRLPDGRGYDVAVAAEELGTKSYLVTDTAGGTDELTLAPVGRPNLRRRLGEQGLTDLLRKIAEND